MAILGGVALRLGLQRPQRGRILLLFQPAEETGDGARALLADDRFCALAPDYIFSLHNLPGLKLGEVELSDGIVNYASTGMRIHLDGKTSHAAMPQNGISPMAVLVKLIPALAALNQPDETVPDHALVTITHCHMGEPNYGIAPGHAELYLSLRGRTDDGLAAIRSRCTALVEQTLARSQLSHRISWHEHFTHCENHPDAANLLHSAMDDLGIKHQSGPALRASEDFGRFAALAPSAMLYLGSGTDQPQLHNPDFDFPDALIEAGSQLFMQVITRILSG